MARSSERSASAARRRCKTTLPAPELLSPSSRTWRRRHKRFQPDQSYVCATFRCVSSIGEDDGAWLGAVRRDLPSVVVSRDARRTAVAQTVWFNDWAPVSEWWTHRRTRMRQWREAGGAAERGPRR